MNINWLVDKENKRVVVSNKKGTMKPREYQDNIEAILIKEDIVEELERDYSTLKTSQSAFIGKLEDTKKKIEENKQNKKSIRNWGIIAFIGIPFYFTILEYFISKALDQYGFLNLTDIFVNFGCSTALISIIGGGFLILPDSPLMEIKRLKKLKQDYEKELERLDLEIAALVQVITKNKAELEELREQKEKSNIELMPITIQEISYSDALELEKTYLTQLKEDNKIEENFEQKNLILGRFRKKKIN